MDAFIAKHADKLQGTLVAKSEESTKEESTLTAGDVARSLKGSRHVELSRGRIHP
jgi:hypothetical protein